MIREGFEFARGAIGLLTLCSKIAVSSRTGAIGSVSSQIVSQDAPQPGTPLRSMSSQARNSSTETL